MKTTQAINRPSNLQQIARTCLLSFWLLVIVFVTALFTDSPSGASNQVIITEYSDFQCPYCKRAARVVEQLRKTYGARVEVVFKQMPLRMHQYAFKAAQASARQAEIDKKQQKAINAAAVRLSAADAAYQAEVAKKSQP